MMRNCRLKGYKGERNGSILILALWILCFLTMLTVSLGYGVRQKVTLAKRMDERLKLRLAAEAGIEQAVSRIRTLYDKDLPSQISYAWRNDPGTYEQIAVADARVDLTYSLIDESTGQVKAMFGFCDEESKININKADMQVMARLFRYLLNCDVTEAQELAASIVDWRDNDSMLSLPLGSAESSYYRNLPYPYEAKDDAFESIDELFLVKGINKETFAKLQNYITIYGSGMVNINTATKPVLLALGLPEAIVTKLMLLRSGKDSIAYTSDDFVFQQSEDIVSRLSQTYNLSSSEVAVVTNLINQYVSVTSHFFSLQARSGFPYSPARFEIACVVDTKGKVLYWKE